MATARALILVNRRARLARRVEWRDGVDRVLRRRFETTIASPATAEETTRLARDAADRYVVVAAGGDGTVNAVARGIVGARAALGILPLGTANDLARELGIPRAIDAAASRIVEGEPRAIDVVEVNGQPFLGVGGLALVSQSALAVTRLKERSAAARALANLLGGNVYRLSATLNLLGRWRISDFMRIEYHSSESSHREILELRAAALFVANHRTTGGGLVLPVNADPRDGAFELGVVAERGRASLAANFMRLASGALLPPGVLVPIRATRALIETRGDDVFVADGELLATGRRFELRVRPLALRVVA